MIIMKLTPAEEKLLKKIGDAQLITKAELKEFIVSNNGVTPRDASSLLDTATRSLMEKDLVSVINPIGSTCYIITKDGSRLLRDND
ncbi:MAG: hypothetical protein J4431_01230 [Candidatus Aenigmarchaeota archaeon]|nr:hypothetical protein [Candidatus Aenigmarchaeota archaeon]